MSDWLRKIQRGYGKKLASIHAWNGGIVVILAVTGLILLGGFWREVLGGGRQWIKWLHIVIGLASIAPVIYYLLLAGKHWKQLKSRPWQKLNVLIVLVLLLGWFGSGILLWQYRAVGPAFSNAGLIIHDLLTWVGLPYMIYHSLTRTKWLKEPNRRAVKFERKTVTDPSAAAGPASPQPVYTRRSFIKGAVGVGLAVTVGPSFLKWMGSSLSGFSGSSSTNDLVLADKNQLIPAPQPLPDSLIPAGGGARGNFRVFTVTPIPSFNNDNWSFTVDGLVDHKLNWNWEQFVRLKRTVQVSDFHCITGWSVYSNTWEGIKLKELLDMAGVQRAARSVKFYSGDGVYTDSLTLEQAYMDDIMIAVMHDGKPIPNDLGGPVRLIVPKMYAYKSVKWVKRIELIEDPDYTGYWEERGYSKNAWI
ncbi:molybdopterin-dependent oxidoreductase [Paenibacillus beijingensis]|uniref:Oxidoreductase n=1 Tax=Paenibacillus beijingensis TaxID=1126833 RepID=A0A0D5NH29_9BACL|nr:molybdopterin-dependent oxidoreductase [Paenibacillus beijingensis]AJY74213.1 oxidoreductase [Paenibacillus beijingensis]